MRQRIGSIRKSNVDNSRLASVRSQHLKRRPRGVAHQSAVLPYHNTGSQLVNGCAGIAGEQLHGDLADHREYSLLLVEVDGT